MQTDPAGDVDSLNLYQYALLDPINNRDPFGLDVCGDPNVPEAKDCITVRGAKTDFRQFGPWNRSWLISGEFELAPMTRLADAGIVVFDGTWIPNSCYSAFANAGQDLMKIGGDTKRGAGYVAFAGASMMVAGAVAGPPGAPAVAVGAAGLALGTGSYLIGGAIEGTGAIMYWGATGDPRPGLRSALDTAIGDSLPPIVPPNDKTAERTVDAIMGYVNGQFGEGPCGKTP